ncbi:hypothetical protein DFH29DRAFT_1035258 [Suillus ampliporus]|nr:hypothetical protein DFH29DRAFT_1035258 [Suillus ampliporus]
MRQVLRLLPISNEEPFHGLTGRFIFMGYVGHAHQLSPVYWPEEYLALAHPPHEILRHVGFLHIANDNMRLNIYEIETGGSAFLNDYRTNFCASNLHGSISPIWLPVFSSPQQHTHTDFLLLPPPAPPAPPAPVDIPAWQTLFAQFISGYEPTLIELTSVFDHLTAPTLPDDDDSDIMSLISTQSISEAQPPHPDLPWRHTVRGDILDKSQKLVLKGLLAASQWGCSIKLAKYLFIGHFLVGIPINPFFVPAAVSRRLITTSFLRALRFNQNTYDELSKEPLTIVNDDGSETVVGWSYLRNRFLDFYIDATSELRKITWGSTSPLAGFAVNEDQKMEKILNLIVAFNSSNKRQVQKAICDLIGTQAFKEVLWAALLRPIAELAEGNARLADLYPDAIQTWTGYLRKGIVGVLITLAFTLQIPSHLTNLKVPELYPSIMAALDEMYMDPDRFAAFFQVVRELPSLQETNVLVMDPKNRVPKYMTDEMGVRWIKTLEDLGPIDVVFTSDFEVPHAQFTFPVPASDTKAHSELTFWLERTFVLLTEQASFSMCKSDPFAVFTLKDTKAFTSQTKKKTLNPGPDWSELPKSMCHREAADFSVEVLDWNQLEQSQSLGCGTTNLRNIEPPEAAEHIIKLSSEKHGTKGQVTILLIFQQEITAKSRKATSTFSSAGRATTQIESLPFGAGKTSLSSRTVLGLLQKIIECVQTPEEVGLIVQNFRAYAPPLLLDQCCLHFGAPANDLIFNAMINRMWEIARGRFGARSMRACLESLHITLNQQRRIATAVILNSIPLATKSNGAMLLTWLLDTSSPPSRYNLLAPHLSHPCNAQLASSTVLRIFNQKIEFEASCQVVQVLFSSPGDHVLTDVLGDQVHSVAVVHKILTSPLIDAINKPIYIEATEVGLPIPNYQPTYATNGPPDKKGRNQNHYGVPSSRATLPYFSTAFCVLAHPFNPFALRSPDISSPRTSAVRRNGGLPLIPPYMTPLSAIPYSKQSPNLAPGGILNMGQPGFNTQTVPQHVYQANMYQVYQQRPPSSMGTFN